MWQQPKTDWKETDFFNVEDYNRIKGNLEAVHEQAVELYGEIVLQDMGADKSYQDYGFYADEINAFEENIERLCAGTYPFQVGEKRLYYSNQPFIGWQELNRIESACRTMYENLTGQAGGRPRLALCLGRGKEIKC